MIFLNLVFSSEHKASRAEEIFKEALALKKLQHKNIVQLYHAFMLKNDLVLIMEHASGGELLQYVIAKKGLEEVEAQLIFFQIVSAVCYFHERYIIHRDLKLENILFSDDLKITPKVFYKKIIDFGIAGSNYGERKEASAAGTLSYMPPEILSMNDLKSNAAIDIWALGVILYAMVYGFMPYTGELI